MPYTTEDGGRINNFANEPKVYQAEPPTKKQKRNYVILGIFGTLLVTGVIAIAFVASNV
ncbi:photosystem II assembly protein Psb34 [Geminocystis sp. GBBB08]|uniref:photosystem II assembly protein Psb34 n=1 Tax=Geminocystis sp. GBBB08 TaxID=2604140 RepID=UPI0027E2DF7B|nr:ssl1498 family light-harvesting-like protein [Geminocystis sp. GBBB08]MBL1211150.1 ssl1498 family light-harvesting-like protein [Geminocystis sp. GBBB08]